MHDDYDLKKLRPQDDTAAKKRMCNWQDSGMTCEFEAAPNSLWCQSHHEIIKERSLRTTARMIQIQSEAEDRMTEDMMKVGQCGIRGEDRRHRRVDWRRIGWWLLFGLPWALLAIALYHAHPSFWKGH